MNDTAKTIRHRLNQYPVLVMSVTTLLVVGTLSYVVIAQGVFGPDTIDTGTSWYYDLNTQQFFKAPAGQRTPIAAPSGPLPTGEPAGVRAWAFGCAGVTDPDQASIVVLETYHPAAFTDEPIVPAEQSAYGPDIPLGYLYRKASEETWGAHRFDIEKVLGVVSDGCGGEAASLVSP